MFSPLTERLQLARSNFIGRAIILMTPLQEVAVSRGATLELALARCLAIHPVNGRETARPSCVQGLASTAADKSGATAAAAAAAAESSDWALATRVATEAAMLTAAAADSETPYTTYSCSHPPQRTQSCRPWLMACRRTVGCTLPGAHQGFCAKNVREL